MRIADTKNIDYSNAYCGIEPARYHAYLRVGRITNLSNRLVDRRASYQPWSIETELVFEWTSDRTTTNAGRIYPVVVDDDDDGRQVPRSRVVAARNEGESLHRSF